MDSGDVSRRPRVQTRLHHQRQAAITRPARCTAAAPDAVRSIRLTMKWLHLGNVLKILAKALSGPVIGVRPSWPPAGETPAPRRRAWDAARQHPLCRLTAAGDARPASPPPDGAVRRARTPSIHADQNDVVDATSGSVAVRQPCSRVEPSGGTSRTSSLPAIAPDPARRSVSRRGKNLNPRPAAKHLRMIHRVWPANAATFCRE